MKYRGPPPGRGQKIHDPSPFLLRKNHTYPGNIYIDLKNSLIIHKENTKE
jgi:hypothetical protein